VDVQTGHGINTVSRTASQHNLNGWPDASAEAKDDTTSLPNQKMLAQNTPLKPDRISRRCIISLFYGDNWRYGLISIGVPTLTDSQISSMALFES
jgi:hypothetical protein